MPWMLLENQLNLRKRSIIRGLFSLSTAIKILFIKGILRHEEMLVSTGFLQEGNPLGLKLGNKNQLMIYLRQMMLWALLQLNQSKVK